MANYDGAIRINTQIDTKGVTTGVAAIQAGLKLVEGSALAAGAALAAAFAPVIVITAIVTILGKLGELGKQAIDTASDLNEVQNVVDTTFGAMAESVNDFADTSLEKFGLSELAAKRYTSTMGAMLKSMGFATAQASDMSQTLAGLAGDMSSFYNISADEAFAKLRSGMSGETEPLKELGVNLSEANLSAFALSKGITTAYSSMTEASKATLRYQYILNATKAAQGDFAKTSGSFANQTRLLAEQWSELVGILGKFLIPLATQFVTVLNGFLGTVLNIAKAVESVAAAAGWIDDTASSTDGLSNSADDAAESQDNLASSISGAAGAASDAMASFDELETLQKGMGGVGASIDTSAIDDLAESLSSVSDADKDNEIEIIVTPDWRGFGDPPVLDPVLVEARPILNIAFVPVTAKEWGLVPPPIPLPEIPPLPFPVFVPEWGLVKSLIPELATVLDGLADLWEKAHAGATEGLAALQLKYAEAKAAALELAENIKYNAGSMKDTVVADMQIMAALSLAAVGAFAVGTSKGIYDMASNGMQNIATMCTNGYSSIYAFANRSYEAFAAWGNGVIKIGVETARNFADAVWDGVKSAWNAVVSYAKATGEKVKEFWGENKKEIITTGAIVATGLGIAAAIAFSAGTLLPALSSAAGAGAAAMAAIPAYATGAVLPPNNPHLAIVGDQKRGTNVETPLDLMIEAFKTALVDMGGTGGDVTVTMPVYLDSEKIYEGQQKVQTRRGTSIVKVGGTS